MDVDHCTRLRSAALDALEEMVAQYMPEDAPGWFSHQHMSPGELACEVLAAQRPDRWELTGDGIRYRIGAYDWPGVMGRPWDEAAAVARIPPEQKGLVGFIPPLFLLPDLKARAALARSLVERIRSAQSDLG